jgi:nucleoside 2-deoxyribosyltransferase
MNVLKYDTPSQDFPKYKKDGPIIFLAGPTVRGNQLHLTSWREEAVRLFEERKFSGTLILPEFQDKRESDQFRYDLPEWEFAGMEIADSIMFWVPRTRELIGLTTNFEFGYWLAKDPNKIVYGRPDGAYRIKYLDILWNYESKRIGNGAEDYFLPTLDETVAESIYVARGIANCK